MADEPRWDEESEDRDLRPLTEKNVTGGRADGPEKNAGGPVFVEIENLRGEEDGSTERGGADGVEGNGEGGKTLSEKGSRDVENRNHKENEGKAESR